MSQEENNMEEKEPVITNAEENQTPTEEKSIDFEKMYNDANDKYLRLYSEFDNYRKRTSRERLELIKNAGSDLLVSILPVLDDLERAIKANETANDIDIVKNGFKLIQSKFSHILTSKGLKQIELLDQPFNSDLAEAIANVPVEDEEKKGKIIDVVENAYSLNDAVIRFGKVVVGQ